MTDHTRQSYASRWRHFERWVASKPGGLSPLPATAETVMLFLADAVDQDPPASLSTLRGRLAAINRVHIEAGHPAPGDDPAMSLLMRGLGRVVEKSRSRDQISALRISELRSALRAMRDLDPRATRDRALLGLLRDGISPEHLSHLRWQDVRVTARGVHLCLRSKPSHEPGAETRLVRARDKDTCATAALLQWQAIAGTEPEHVFTHVDQHGRRAGRYLHAYDIARIAGSRLDSLGTEGTAASLDEAMRLLAGAPSQTLRDRAVLLVGFAGAFRRNELCLLRWSDVTPHPDGVILRLRRSKTDPAGRGRNVGIPRGRSELTCPVTALSEWRTRMHAQLGSSFHPDLPVLTRIGKAGRVGVEPITPAVVTRIVVNRAKSASLAGHWGGRSLRAGFITTAADLDLPLEQIAQQSRHASLDNLVRYIRAEDPFSRNAADWVGL